MNIGAILAGIGLLTLVAAFVARPLFEGTSGKKGGPAVGASRRARLTARRDAVYALIRELDTDYQTGKVNEQDYQTQRKRYVAEGVNLLKQLDELEEDGPDTLEAEIEAAVLALREARRVPKVARHSAIDRFCTQCGHPATPENNFCGRCGAPLKRTAGE